MKVKKFIIYLLWAWLAIFIVSTVLSYSNALDADGSLRLGFPFAFYHKSAGMGGMSGDDGIFSNFMFHKLFKDLAVAFFPAIIVALVWTWFKRSK